MTKETMRKMIKDFTRDELVTLRAMINGKLSRRTISREQQEKMQAARKT